MGSPYVRCGVAQLPCSKPTAVLTPCVLCHVTDTRNSSTGPSCSSHCCCCCCCCCCDFAAHSLCLACCAAVVWLQVCPQGSPLAHQAAQASRVGAAPNPPAQEAADDANGGCSLQCLHRPQQSQDADDVLTPVRRNHNSGVGSCSCNGWVRLMQRWIANTPTR